MDRRKCNRIRGEEEKGETASVESLTKSDYRSSGSEKKNTFRPTAGQKPRQPWQLQPRMLCHTSFLIHFFKKKGKFKVKKNTDKIVLFRLCMSLDVNQNCLWQEGNCLRFNIVVPLKIQWSSERVTAVYLNDVFSLSIQEKNCFN